MWIWDDARIVCSEEQNWHTNARSQQQQPQPLLVHLQQESSLCQISRYFYDNLLSTIILTGIICLS